MMKPVIKFWRISDDKTKLILIPTKEGIDVIRGHTDFIEGQETIGEKVKLFAFIFTPPSLIRFVQADYRFYTNENLFYIYTENQDKYYFSFPIFIT